MVVRYLCSPLIVSFVARKVSENCKVTMAAKVCNSDKLWKEYQSLNKRYMDTNECIEGLKKELDVLGRGQNQWKNICVKSLHNIRDQIQTLQTKDEKLSSGNKKLVNEIAKSKKEIQKLEKQIRQKQQKKK